MKISAAATISWASADSEIRAAERSPTALSPEMPNKRWTTGSKSAATPPRNESDSNVALRLMLRMEIILILPVLQALRFVKADRWESGSAKVDEPMTATPPNRLKPLDLICPYPPTCLDDHSLSVPCQIADSPPQPNAREMTTPRQRCLNCPLPDQRLSSNALGNQEILNADPYRHKIPVRRRNLGL